MTQVRTMLTDLNWRTDEYGIDHMIGVASVNYRSDDAGTQYKLGEKCYERVIKDTFKRALAEQHPCEARLEHEACFTFASVPKGTLELWIDDIGLNCDITVPRNPPAWFKELNVAEDVRAGKYRMSFCFRNADVDWTIENGNAIRWLKSLDLIDVAPVLRPAYQSTKIGMRVGNPVADMKAKLFDAKTNTIGPDEWLERDRINQANDVAIKLRLLDLEAAERVDRQYEAMLARGSKT